MVFTIKKEKEFSYIEKGEGEVLLLLHGLFGALSNWEGVLKYFSPHYKVVIPSLPIYVMPLRKMSLESLVKFIEAFVEFKKFESFTLVGSSLGGHLGLIYTLRYPEKIKRLVLESPEIYPRPFVLPLLLGPRKKTIWPKRLLTLKRLPS